jgi:transposase-like protein
LTGKRVSTDYETHAIVTDKLPSYGAAKQDVMPTVAHHLETAIE